MSPGKSRSKLLREWLVGVGLCQRLQINQIARGKAFHVRGGGSQVAGKASDEFGAPTFALPASRSRPICQ